MSEECSFCGKDNTKVKKLIVSDEVAICSGCIILCSNLIDDTFQGVDVEKVQVIDDIDPTVLKKYLDKYVVSQDNAKMILSVAVSNHYKRINIGDNKIDKSNVILLGPSGSGKTLLARSIANYIDVPFVTTDATLLTEAGYVGDDVDSLLIKLLQSADGELHKAENGIIFIDEVDKISKKLNSNGADVSGEGVQQALLKLVEGSVYTFEYEHEEIELDTTNILFIASGAFVDLNSIKKNKHSMTKMGFGADLDPKILIETDCEDLVKFGLIPEFVGRFPIIAEVDELTEEDMLDILNTVENNLIGQYTELFKYDKVKISFHKEALKTVVKIAIAKKTGARGLKSILEKSLLPHMFNVAKYSKQNIKKLIISKELITNPKEIKKT